MKKLLFAGSVLLLASCSTESKVKAFRYKNVGSYEFSSQILYYEMDVYKVALKDKQGKVIDSVMFYFDLEREKPRRLDQNRNIRINPKIWKSLLVPKWKLISPYNKEI